MGSKEAEVKDKVKDDGRVNKNVVEEASGTGNNVVGSYDFKSIEPKILDFWNKNTIYAKAKEKCKGGKSYYFLDGPPYTSGKVHIGTAWNKTLKDMVLRYKRMQGFNVWDRAGYDMHGLPTEHATEKKLNLNGKEDIVKYGVDKFIQECEKLCVENMEVMNKDFMKLGVWMDFENAYQSIKKEFIEGEWWLIKKAHENGRLYEGKRTMTWCASCATAIAKHELEYKEVHEESIFLKFPVIGKENEFLIIWTTTPWTIPFNLAVMVNPKLDYVKCEVEDGDGKGKKEIWIVAKALAATFIQGVVDKKFELVEEFKGEKLEGIKYKHPFQEKISFFAENKDNPKLHTVLLSSEYVDTSAGSGLVHCAPGCGPEDYEVGHKNGLPPFNRVDEKGFFKDMGEFNDLRAKKDDKKFIEAMEETGFLITTTSVSHDYPHCWRCHQAVVFRTTKQWFFKVEDIKETMIVENNMIKWVPEAAFNAFNSWLNNLRDNSITKQRFWGCPIPVWKCECGEYDVVESVAEIEKKSGKKLDAKHLHKPWIDKISWKCDCGKEKKRIPDILDVWVDAGTTSWNCLDYPHNKEQFNELFPAEFILEGKDQIRGWFNLLMVASMIAIGKPSFKNVYMHGFVQDAKGRKMSKSLGNYILPEEVISAYGADTFRCYAIGGANPGVDLNYNFKDMKIKHRNLMVLWNVHKFLLDYAATLGVNPLGLTREDIEHSFAREEKYILSKLATTIKRVTHLLDTYELNKAPWLIEELFLELSRTYIQLVREKSAMGSEEEKKAVLYTIYTVLSDVLKLLSPVTPMVSECMYQNFKKAFGLEEESVHFLSWPKAVDGDERPELEESMDVAQYVIQAVLAAREKVKLGVKWPVKEIILETDKQKVHDAVESMQDLIMLQTNVKLVKVTEKMEGVQATVQPNKKALIDAYGGVLGSKISAETAKVDGADVLKHLEEDGSQVVTVDGEKFEVKPGQVSITKKAPEGYQEANSKYGLVYLNKERTPELDAEGFAREIMRRVQSMRKEADLQKKDRIVLEMSCTDAGGKVMLESWSEKIKEKVGAEVVKITEQVEEGYKQTAELKIKGKKFSMGFAVCS